MEDDFQLKEILLLLEQNNVLDQDEIPCEMTFTNTSSLLSRSREDVQEEKNGSVYPNNVSKPSDRGICPNTREQLLVRDIFSQVWSSAICKDV